MDETWSGTVVVDGVVAVRRGAVLKILPGTRVLFRHLDADADGIGDGELYVEGSIIARGEPGREIVFSDADGIIEPSRWKYVMANHAREAVFEHCIFEGAFSGLQVHFTGVRLRGCLFRRNVDGFRFSTADVSVCGCTMTGNVHGIRYEERDSTGIISHNEIRGNEIGIFAVTRCTGKVAFRNNNIYNNDILIKAGYDQREPLSFAGNWFGTDRDSAILKGIYGRNVDASLVPISYRPFLKQKIETRMDTCVQRQ